MYVPITYGELNLDKSSFQLNYKKVTLYKKDGFGAQEIGLHNFFFFWELKSFNPNFKLKQTNDRNGD